MSFHFRLRVLGFVGVEKRGRGSVRDIPRNFRRLLKNVSRIVTPGRGSILGRLLAQDRTPIRGLPDSFLRGSRHVGGDIPQNFAVGVAADWAERLGIFDVI